MQRCSCQLQRLCDVGGQFPEVTALAEALRLSARPRSALDSKRNGSPRLMVNPHDQQFVRMPLVVAAMARPRATNRECARTVSSCPAACSRASWR